MPLIKPKAIDEETQIRVRIKKSVVNEMDQYIEWAKISNHSHFIEEAIGLVLSKDKEWLKFKNDQS